MQAHEDNAVVIGIGGDVVSLDDYLLKRVSDFLQGIQLLVLFHLGWQSVCRLDIVLVNAIRSYKIHFVLNILLLSISLLPWPTSQV